MTTTIMEKEARETPDRIAEQLTENAQAMQKLGAQIRDLAPSVVVTIARGSSDHASVYGKYLMETQTGIPVSSAAPSVVTVYGKQLQLKNALAILVSQSGRSPDILAQAEMAKKAGAFCVAFVNDETSPVTDMVDAVIPLKAGEETAVAATKSYLGTLSAFAHLVAEWTNNKELSADLQELPGILSKVQDAPAQLNPEPFKDMDHCIALGRSFGYAISLEIALKMKEVCSIQAEAFSSAEFLHGPVTLVERGLSILDVSIKDESYDAHQQQVDEVKRRGADLIHLNQVINDMNPRLAPIALMQRFYLDIEKVALSRGINPDAPPGLKKVTETV